MNSKPIKDFEDLYLIYEDGSVWSLTRKRFLSQDPHTSGYLRVTLWKEGKGIHKYVHRLVAEAFLPNPDNLPQVNHKDENKHNNCIDNLEWMSALDNTRYGTGIKRRIEKQINSPKRSRKIIQYDLNMTEVARYPSIMEAQRITGYANTNISKACKETFRTVGGYYWRYEE